MSNQVDYKELSKDLALELVQTSKMLNQANDSFQVFAYDISQALGLEDQDLEGIKFEDLIDMIKDLKGEIEQVGE